MVSHRGSHEQACSLLLLRLASSLTPPASVSLSCLALRVRACKETPNIHALPVLMLRQVYVGVVFSVSFWVSLLVRSWAGRRRFWIPTWLRLGPILAPCGPPFGQFLGVVLASQLKTALRSDFC